MVQKPDLVTPNENMVSLLLHHCILILMVLKTEDLRLLYKNTPNFT